MNAILICLSSICLLLTVVVSSLNRIEDVLENIAENIEKGGEEE